MVCPILTPTGLSIADWPKSDIRPDAEISFRRPCIFEMAGGGRREFNDDWPRLRRGVSGDNQPQHDCNFTVHGLILIGGAQFWARGQG